jgi:hypothetical protein
MLGWLMRHAFGRVWRVDNPGTVDVTDPNDPASWKSLDYIHDQVMAQIDAQLEQWNAVDARLRLVLGVVSLVVAVAASFFQRPAASDPAALLPWWIGWLMIAAIVGLLISAAIAVIGLWPSKMDRPPQPDRLRDEYLLVDVRTTKLDVVDTLLAAYDLNDDRIEWKFRCFKLSFLVAALGIGLLGVAVIGYISTQMASAPLPILPTGSPKPAAHLIAEIRQ